MNETAKVLPAPIAFPEAGLADLRDRLARTRWPRPLPGAGWERGVPVDYLRDLAEYWRTGFDWRAQEERINALGPSVTTIDGLDVHFLHVRSPEPGAVPLILSHGWPNSIVEFLDVIGPLTDPRAHGGDPARAFHVVAPSIPGFGLSSAPADPAFRVPDVARILARLMHVLGYDRYGVQGGDLGAYIAPAVAEADPEHVIGVFVNGGLGFPSEADVPEMTPDELAAWEQAKQWMGAGVDHHALLHAAPQTFGFGWHDSPVGLLSWLIHKFQEFGITTPTPEQAIDRDLLLANATLYWLTGTESSSSWFMYGRAGEFAMPKGQSLVPSGVYGGLPAFRRLAERHNRILHWPEDNPGGHFVAMEQPLVLARELRAFFTKAGAWH